MDEVGKKLGDVAKGVKDGVGNAVGKVADLSPVHIPLLSTAVKTYKFQEVKIDILEKNVFDAKVQNIFIPLSENLKFDIAQFDVPQDKRANFEKELENVINSQQGELNKQNIVNVTIENPKDDYPLREFKNLMFLKVPNATNDVIASLIVSITKKAEELKLDHLAIPKIQRSGQIGANDAEIAKVIGKAVFAKYGKAPVQGEVFLPRLAFFCTDAKWNQELIKGFDEAPNTVAAGEPGKKPESDKFLGIF